MCRHLLIFFFFFFNDTATTEIYTLSLHDALPIFEAHRRDAEHREGRGHRVGGELTAAGALARARRALDGVQLLVVDLPGVGGADRPQTSPPGPPLAPVLAGTDRSRGRHPGGQARPGP